jgi:hypothetical protein
LPTLIAAAAALGDVIGRPVSLAELFTGEGQVQINEKLSLDTSALRAALLGKTVTAEREPLTDGALALAQITHARIAEDAKTAHGPKRLRTVKPDLRRDVLRDFTESDARMCKNIGVNLELGAAAMATLWGRTFTAERNHRAGPGANAQKRGQISRQLKAELQGVVNDGHH